MANPTRKAILRWLCNSRDGRETVADLIRSLDRCSDHVFAKQFDPPRGPKYRGSRVHYEPSDPHDFATACGLDEWWEYRCSRDPDMVTCGRCRNWLRGGHARP